MLKRGMLYECDVSSFTAMKKKLFLIGKAYQIIGEFFGKPGSGEALDELPDVLQIFLPYAFADTVSTLVTDAKNKRIKA